VTVWADLVGQEDLVERLRETVAGSRAPAADAAGRSTMAHAWLFTGPPGSGRSNAALAFAAGLLCDEGGCGRCRSCLMAKAGSHPDITSVVSDQSVIKVDPIRELVRQAALAPSIGRWQVIVLEDADRLNDKAGDALLKSIEEPSPRTVWLLCAPTAEDVLPTLRSRCRTVVLRTPPPHDVAAYLERKDGVTPPVAAYAARASQGHIGRARALARDEPTRNRRREVLRIPSQLVDLGSAMTCAANLLSAATEESEPRAAKLDTRETGDLEAAFGVGGRGGRAVGYAPALKELQRNQRQRSKRLVRDCIDRSLLDLASFYRDVLTLQVGAGSVLVNEEQRDEVATLARRGSGERTVEQLSSIFATRELLDTEVSPALALEALMLALGGIADE
jgi:DNA polymerase-3 subunit delta'